MRSKRLRAYLHMDTPTQKSQLEDRGMTSADSPRRNSGNSTGLPQAELPRSSLMQPMHLPGPSVSLAASSINLCYEEFSATD